MSDFIDVVFDKFPGPDSPRFVEVEHNMGSIEFGEWREISGGFKALSFCNPRPAMESALSFLEGIYDPENEELYRVRYSLEQMINEFPRTPPKPSKE